METGGGSQMMTVTDPDTGLSLRLEVTRQYKQTVWEFDLLWGLNWCGLTGWWRFMADLSPSPLDRPSLASPDELVTLRYRSTEMQISVPWRFIRRACKPVLRTGGWPARRRRWPRLSACLS